MVHVEYLDGTAEDIEASYGFIIDNDSDMFCIEGPSGLYVMIPKLLSIFRVLGIFDLLQP